MNEKKLDRPFYTKYAWAYDFLVPRPYQDHCKFIDRIIKENGISSESKILDAGCGTGNYSIELARKGYSVTGVDLSKEQIIEAVSKIENNTLPPKFYSEDLFSLNEIGFYDVVLCRGVLNDIIEDDSRDRLLSRFNEFLKPGGLLISDVRNWEKSVVEISQRPEVKKSVLTERGLLRFASIRKIDRQKQQYFLQETHQLLQNELVINEDKHDFIMRCWTEEELISRLGKSGFSDISCYGGFSKEIKVGESVYIVCTAFKSRT